MKNITITLLVFISSISLHSQTQIDIPETWETDVWIGNWTLATKVTYTFNTNCLATQGLLEVNNFTTNMLENSSLLTILYNANDLFDETINALWNSSTSSWEENLKAEFIYDTSNNLINTTNFDKVNNDWVFKDRVLQEYLPSNLLLRSTSQNYDETSTSWVDISKSEYTYNTDNTIDIIINYTWDTVAGWVNDSRITHTYSNTLLFQKEDSSWDGNNWVNDDLTTYTYDSNNFLTLTLIEEWDGSSYINDQQELRSNNTDGNPTERITQNFMFGSWMNSSRDTRTYPTCSTLSIDDFTEDIEITIYPNPASNEIKINSKEKGEISFLDVNGRTLITKPTVTGQNKLDVSLFQSGIYLLIFNTNERQITKRIIIDK